MAPTVSDLDAWLRRERKARSWTRAEMARRLIKAARASGDTTMPYAEHKSQHLSLGTRRHRPSERYKLYYCKAFGISSSDFETIAGQRKRERAQRWDHLVELLKSQSLRDTHVLHVSNLRRATLMLLASHEELPNALVAELRAYRLSQPDTNELWATATGLSNAFP